MFEGDIDCSGEFSIPGCTLDSPMLEATPEIQIPYVCGGTHLALIGLKNAAHDYRGQPGMRASELPRAYQTLTY